MDKKLVADFKSGDIKAFEQVFIAYYMKIMLFIRAILKSESDAQDLAQSIFTKLWENRENFNPTTSLDGYMFTTARNAAINHIRSKKLHESILRDTTGGKDTDMGTDEQVHAQEIIRIIDRKVAELPVNYGTIYRLSQQEGLTPAQIAKQLDVSEKRVRNLLSIISKELRMQVDNYFER